MKHNDGRFLTDSLCSRMSTALILSYAFPIYECQAILKLTSKSSYKYFTANRVALENMCVSIRQSKFWGRQTKRSCDT